MHILKVVTIGFLILEISNVIVLYFFPGSKNANGVGVFKAWEKSKLDTEIHHFVRYLVNWVAGAKLIFILLLLVLLTTADEPQLIWMGVALMVSIASFFWRLFPLIRQMDRANEIEPANYSLILGWMIFAFIFVFLSAIIVTVII
ncbi:MAG: hypothetical protein GVY30_06765 [Chloroflexi bacterium]|jgi:hypothetical protein|nr:hypothetical protein [Chloroflexota bacterium]